MKNTTKIICFLGCGLLVDTTFAVASHQPSANGEQPPANEREQNPFIGKTKIFWSSEEDQKLITLVEQHGTKNWQFIAEQVFGRNARQCRQRWVNYLDPSKQKINGPWTPEEDKLLGGKVTELGTKWKEIAAFFPERTPNNIKNRWYKKLSKEIDQGANPNPGQKKIYWTPPEDLILWNLLEQQPDTKNWHPIADKFPDRSAKQCEGRWNHIKSQPKPTILPQQQIPAMMAPVHRNNERWTQQEDQALWNAVKQYGTKSWVFIAKQVPNHTVQQCRERWFESLNPLINREPWTQKEDQILLDKVSELGMQWSKIAQFLQGRTANGIRSRWNNYLSKRINPQLNPATVVSQPQPIQAMHQPQQGISPSQGNLNWLDLPPSIDDVWYLSKNTNQ